jgi:hypothetical protein
MNPANEPEDLEGAPGTTPHRSFLDDDVADGHEHGERKVIPVWSTSSRADVGTTQSSRTA